MSYFHMRMFWGAFDVSYSTPSYSGAALVSGGPSAAAGSGVGVRRASLIFTRTPPGTFADDVAVMHWDFLNLTSGVPDDTWITSDFTGLETLLSTWWTAMRPRVSTTTTLKEIRWYREGTGVVPPNPPARVTTIGVAGSDSSGVMPPQVAISITLKTSARKQWGRTYVPGLGLGGVSGNGIISNAFVDGIATASDALITGAASSDMHVGVLSKVAGSFFVAEQVQVDNLFDVIRRRRWRNATYRKVLP